MLKPVKAFVTYLIPMTVVVASVGWQPAAGAESADYIHFNLGMKYKAENRLDDASEEFRRVLAGYPDNYNAYIQLADIYQTQKNPRMAIFNLKKALDYNPGWNKAQLMLARAYEADGQYEKAMMTLQEYKASCDPGERDSIQARINYLVRRSQGAKTASTGVADTQPGQGPGYNASESSVSGPRAGARHVAASVQPVGSASAAVEVLFQKVIALYNDRKFDEATAAIQKVLAAQPGHPGAYYYAGLIRRRAGDNAKAKYDFEKALAFPDLGYNAHFYLGRIYGEEKQYGVAVEHLEAYIQKTTNETGAREARDLIAQYRAASDDMTRASHSRDSAAHVELPLDLEAERGVKEPAITSVDVHIDSMLSMSVADTLSDAGQKLLGGVREFMAGRYDNAVTEFKKVLVKYPNGGVAVQCMYNLGLCYYKLRLFKEAENQFDQIIERYGTHQLAARAAFLKALGYLERKETPRAETLLREFIQHNPKHEWVGRAYEKLGDAYIDLEKPKMAIDAYNEAAVNSRTLDDQVGVHFKLGTTYFDVQNPTRALASFEKIIEIGARNNLVTRVPDAYYRIADYAYQQKDAEKALSYYTRATRLFPNFQETPWGLFQIGNIHKSKRDFKTAIDTYKDLMQRFPDDYWAKQAKWKMDDATWENEYRGVLK